MRSLTRTIGGGILLMGALVSLMSGMFLSSVSMLLLAIALLPIPLRVRNLPLTASQARVILFVVGVALLIAAPQQQAPSKPSSTNPPTPIVPSSVASSFAMESSAASSIADASEVTTVVVSSVVDGDTIKVRGADNTVQTLRIVGIDSPETVHPSKPVECFGREASSALSTWLTGTTVKLERKPGEDRDVYDRLLRYVSLNGEDIGAKMIAEGYAHSYRQYPHPRLSAYNELERTARSLRKGLWGDVCSGEGAIPIEDDIAAPPDEHCVIKGNISYQTNERIYHVPGCATYADTNIDTSAGEQWFCTEKDAVAAGWRKAKNCP